MKSLTVLKILSLMILGNASLVNASSEPIPPRPLTESCEPLGMTDKLKIKFDEKAYWQKTKSVLRQYKAGTLLFLRIAPVEMERELRNIVAEHRKDRILIPEMYQGDLAQMTLEMERDSINATRALWYKMIGSARQDVLWADKCLSIVDRRLSGL